MHPVLRLATLSALALLAACGRIPGDIDAKADAPGLKAIIPDNAVVIAVVDGNINPYHWDYVGAKMPAHELPLDTDPGEWLPGHPGGAGFKSYQALRLSLDTEDPETTTADLHDEDINEWAQIQYSTGNTNADVNYYWFPGTKIIGHVAFGGSGSVDTYATTSHGVGTSSVSTGNIHGTCPSCLLVFVHGTVEQANEWVAKQDWIDLQTNSFGHSVVGGFVRDLIYAKSDTELQRQTVERGQSIFFSGGNGLINDFSVTHSNLFSSEKGPDWIITVGAISPDDGASFSGHGRPADISSLGDGYPSAASDQGTTTATGSFGGTSNAAPVIAGIYGEALVRLRQQLGSKRMQKDGVIAEGPAGCKAANPNCALADGKLTVHELREALFRSAQYTGTGVAVGTSLLGIYVTVPETENVAELEFLSEGHGSFMGKLLGKDNYEAEIQRVVGFADGSWFTEQDADQRDWMVADSLCRQGGWGSWDHGYAPLFAKPAPSPEWPVRTWLAEVCPSFLNAAVTAEKALLP
jgi:hypothetical protein